MTDILTLAELAARVSPGDHVALPVDYAGVSMAMTPHLIAHGAGGLRITCVPTGGMQVDMLIGAGLVSEVETSAMSLGEAGATPCFNAAVAAGTIDLRDATCPAIHTGLLAAQKGVPFIPMRGVIGSDLPRHRPDWRVIDNPLADGGDPILLIPAITPDVALFHAPMADRQGNVWIGRRRELAAMAYAARRTLVTVERIVETDLFAEEMTAAGALPGLYIDAIAEAPNGAAPYGLWGQYDADGAEIARYAAAAATPEGFLAYLSDAAWIREATA